MPIGNSKAQLFSTLKVHAERGKNKKSKKERNKNERHVLDKVRRKYNEQKREKAPDEASLLWYERENACVVSTRTWAKYYMLQREEK